MLHVPRVHATIATKRAICLEIVPTRDHLMVEVVEEEIAMRDMTEVTEVIDQTGEMIGESKVKLKKVNLNGVKAMTISLEKTNHLLQHGEIQQ